MQTPLFLLCTDGDLRLFDSADALTRYVEFPDVEARGYSAIYDATGLTYAAQVERPTRYRRFLGLSTIELSPVSLRSTGEWRPDALARLLAARLEQEPDALSSLVEQARRKWGKRGSTPE